MEMKIPAYTVPSLACLGRTFDCHTSTLCKDIFQPHIPIKTERVNTLSFKYKAVTSNADVKELMHLPSDLPLKIKANKLPVEGPGKYLNDDFKIEEAKTEILAVMTCITVSKEVEDSAAPNDKEQLVDGLGTHYVRRISYGGQMVASIKLNFFANSLRPNLKGIVEDDLISEATAVSLSNMLDSILSDCRAASNISVTYYTTDAPSQPGTTQDLEELLNLFGAFRSKTVNSGQDIPIEVELHQTEALIPSARAYLPNMALTYAIEEIESRFDDLRAAQYLVKVYQQGSEAELDEEMKRFIKEMENVCQTFDAAISTLDVSVDESQFNECFVAYENALNGIDAEGKFTHFWRKLLTNKLPQGKDLTITVIGKSGSGKSATANSIVGREIFSTSASATSTESLKFQFESRTDERRIGVFDIPGSFKSVDVQKEFSQILELATDGFDAIVLVAKYGSRFTDDDAKGLQQLREFLGDDANEYIIIVLTHGDQVKHEAAEACLDNWLASLPDWVQQFVQQIKNRVLLFNNQLKPHSHPEYYKRQLCNLIQAIDGITRKRSPFLHNQNERKGFEEKILEAFRKSFSESESDSQDLQVVQVPISDEGEGQVSKARGFISSIWGWLCNIF